MDYRMIWRACPLQRDGWRFQLLLQRRAADGEWETVDESVRDSPTGAMLAMVEPFLSGERQMRVRHGLSDVPVVYRPTFMGKSIAWNAGDA